MKKIATTLFIAGLLTSCKESLANFTDPQPVNKKFRGIPKKIKRHLSQRLF